MAENVLDSGPPSAKRPKLSSPALSVSASDGNDFGSLFDLEHDLPDELINSSELGLVNGGDLSQLHTSLGGGEEVGWAWALEEGVVRTRWPSTSSSPSSFDQALHTPPPSRAKVWWAAQVEPAWATWGT
ncbi:hypothetical protein J4Q44_G00278120 [Coregonus suidteri]|uniref:Uncharacterized protein n=1 Tax=Coregonus suidteri TaxID=861788 RepID=A0AAN8QE04_9TELE